MRQVIDNLLNNSIKFIHTTKPQIICSISTKKGLIYFEIQDNWIWFKWIDISQIFEKYSKGGHAMVGLWMGLYLCKRIVEMHGGEIKAQESKKLWWAHFQFSLPM
jgi:signal transduction histidine kinase